MPVKKLSISLHPKTLADVESRMDSTDGERSGTINRLLDRYFDLLAREQVEMNALFSDGEKGLILDVLNGVGFFDPWSLYHVSAEISDGIAFDAVYKEWEAGAALKAKLAALNNGQCHALVDAVQAWWNRIARGEQLRPSQLFERKEKASSSASGMATMM